MENEVHDNGTPIKRKRGRPRKNKVSHCLTSLQDNMLNNCTLENEVNDNSTQIKRKRGRPRKNKEVSNCLTPSPDRALDNSNNLSTELKNNNQSVQTSRSGRAVKQPSRYGNYMTEEDCTESAAATEVYECDACARTFLSRCSIYSHQYICTADKELSCDLCQEKLHSYKDLWTHQKTHRSYTCDFCKQEFNTIAEFRVHSRWHSLQTLECNICHKRFLRVKPLKEHMVQVHDQPMELYTCAMCQKTFALLDYLKEHQKTHEGEDGFTMEYIVKPLVKDVAKRNTCIQDKPGKKRKEFIKKIINEPEERNDEKVDENIELGVDRPMVSVRDSVNAARKAIKESKQAVVHVHVKPDEVEGNHKIVSTCQQKQVTVGKTQQYTPQEELTADAIFSLVGDQLPEGCVVVLTESEEAVNELVRQAATDVAPTMEAIQPEPEHQHHKENHTGNGNQEVVEDGNNITPSTIGNAFVSEVEEAIQTCGENQLKEQGMQHQQLVVNEEIVDEHHQMHHPGSQTVHNTDQTILEQSDEITQENQQIYLHNGQTIVVEQDNNLQPGQEIYLQTFSENGQQIVMQGDGPTVFIQEGPDGHQQHVVLQTDGSDGHHVIVQDAGDIVGNNQHVIMQSDDGTTLLLEGDCSVGDSIIVAAMQNV